jgi:hypothetical protein
VEPFNITTQSFARLSRNRNKHSDYEIPDCECPLSRAFLMFTLKFFEKVFNHFDSDSLLTASQVDGVFRSDRSLKTLAGSRSPSSGSPSDPRRISRRKRH